MKIICNNKMTLWFRDSAENPLWVVSPKWRLRIFKKG